jgi:hypothetical protein
MQLIDPINLLCHFWDRVDDSIILDYLHRLSKACSLIHLRT